MFDTSPGQHLEKSDLSAVAFETCDFKIGDTVTYTNDAGVAFKGLTVLGFSKPHPNGRTVHLDKDAWWFPVNPNALSLETASTFTQSISKIAECTEANNRLEAYILCCDLIGESADQIKIELELWKGVRDGRNGLGFDGPQNDAIYSLYQSMLALAKNTFNPVMYNQMYQAT